jgi:hypothetical protein
METLSSLERTLIVSYLADENVMLNIFCSSPRHGGEEFQKDVQLSVETGKSGVFVSKDGIVTLKEEPTLETWAQKDARVTVVFYFRKLGLTFDSTIEKTLAGFKLAIPKEITRLKEKDAEEKDVTASVYFSLSGKKDVRFACESNKRFPLFKAEVWQHLNSFEARAVVNTARTLQQWFNVPAARLSKPLYEFIEKTGRLLYKKDGGVPQKKPFDFDLCVTQGDLSDAKNAKALAEEIENLPYAVYMPLDGEHCLCAALAYSNVEREAIENLLAAVSACTFAVQGERADEPLQNRASPLSIVFLSDKFLVLGGKTAAFPLQEDQEYAVQISCAIPSGKRIIHAAIRAGSVVAPEGESFCACVCLWTSIEAEDTRFLFEKLYGTIFK